MKTLFLSLLSVLLLLGFCSTTFAQEDVDHSYKPLKLKLNEKGDKYIRFIMWHQLWLTSNNLTEENSNLQMSVSIRRSRFLAFSQISPKFLILTHFGLNGLSAANLSSLGSNGDAPKLFLHGAWGEVMLHKSVYVGAGLHYWRGLTRLNNASTLNFMTLDQSRPFNSWHSLGITDQFARHLGIYIKGSAGKFEYRVAFNNPMRTPLGAGIDYSGSFAADGIPQSAFTYTGVGQVNDDGKKVGNSILEGYIKYNIFDNESTKLPYYVGTYMGKKKVLAIGAGFFVHPNGMYDNVNNKHSSVAHFAVDAYLDMPVMDGEGAVNAYLSFQQFNYGENYISRWGGTGSALYGQFGYFIKSAKLMPYLAYSTSIYQGADDPISAINAGLNYYINGHNAKVSLEYHSIMKDYREGAISVGGLESIGQIRMQLHIFL